MERKTQLADPLKEFQISSETGLDNILYITDVVFVIVAGMLNQSLNWKQYYMDLTTQVKETHIIMLHPCFFDLGISCILSKIIWQHLSSPQIPFESSQMIFTNQDKNPTGLININIYVCLLRTPLTLQSLRGINFKGILYLT